MQVRFSRCGIVMLGAGLLLISGCSGDDDPTTPSPEPSPDYVFPAAPDAVLANMVTAFAEGDTAGLQDLLHPTYRFLFSSQDLSDYDLPSNYLTRSEELLIARNMFSGDAVVNYEGAIAPQLSAITFADFVPIDADWVAGGTSSPFPEALRRRYAYQVSLAIPGNTDFAFGGEVDFHVTSRDSVQGDGSTRPYHQLAGQSNLVDTVKARQGGLTWTVFRMLYLTNERPTAVLNVEWPNETADMVRLDAGASSDRDSGLHASAYRWRFEAQTSWSSWGSEAMITHAYDAPGTKVAQVEVRDRWRGSSGTEQSLVITAIFPDSPDKLMGLFRAAYSSRDLPAYAGVLHPEYTFIFSAYDIDSGEFPTDPLDLATELDITSHMFSGEPFDSGHGWIEPAIAEIQMEGWNRITTWDDQVIHPIFPAGASRSLFDVDLSVFRPGAGGGVPTTILIGGPQEFWTTATDSLLTDGTVRPFWQLVGQTDLTTPYLAGTEGATWGALKAIYR